jgi:arylsulfatase A-like enzyme
LLDIAGITHTRQFNGRKVRPMQGKSVLDMFEGTSPTAYAGANQVGYELFGMKAYFVGNWKILWMPKPFGQNDWELFNLKQDPAELNDLSKQNPDKLKEMIALWEQYKNENNVLDISIEL